MTLKDIVQKAFDEYQEGGAIEIDRDTAKVSHGTDWDPAKVEGAYVQAWVWVAFEPTD